MRVPTIFMAGVLALAGSGLAMADQPGPDWMNKDAVKAKMRKAGYSGIVMSADDGHWEGEAILKGRIVEFHADAKTGAILKSEPKRED